METDKVIKRSQLMLDQFEHFILALEAAGMQIWMERKRILYRLTGNMNHVGQVELQESKRSKVIKQ